MASGMCILSKFAAMTAKKENKTNAARLLDKAGIRYKLNAYTVDENDLSAVHVAGEMGVRPDELYKTLVLRGDRNGIFVCVVPGDCEVDLKKAARISGNKKAEMLHVKELLPLTGYIRGGCSPIGMKKHYPTFVDAHISEHDTVYVSAGVRGLQIVIAPDALVGYLDAVTGDLIVDDEKE